MEGQLSVEQLAVFAQRQAAHIEAQETRLRLQDERIGNLSNQIVTVSVISSSTVSKAVKAIGDFDRNVEQYADWVQVCENYAKFHKMTDAELLNAADSHLKDRASKAVKETEDNGHKPTTWAELKYVLVTYFKDRRTQDQWRKALGTLKCTRAEELQKYTDIFIAELLSIKDMSMRDKIYHYVEGLPSKIAEDVRRSHLATLEKAVEAAHDAASNLGASIIVPCVSFPTAVVVSVPTQPLAIRPSVYADSTGPAPMDIRAVDS